MASYSIWQARGFANNANIALELGEFHLYSGATRVDGGATLTASEAPTSGTLAALKDGVSTTGCYWNVIPSNIILTWVFPSPVDITHIALGCRTTEVRFPRTVVMLGLRTGSDDVQRVEVSRSTGSVPFVSGALSAPIPLGAVGRASTGPVRNFIDRARFGRHGGRIPFLIEKQVQPATVPPTYVPQWAKVRLENNIDGAVVAEKWSDPVTGIGAFENLDENYLYTLTAIYPDSGMRAVIADRIKPEGYPEPTP